MHLISHLLFLGIGETFIMELKTRFPTNAIMDALGIVYPQYRF
jgi:hypothetical protein